MVQAEAINKRDGPSAAQSVLKLWGKVMSPRKIKQVGTRMELRSTKI